VLFSLTGRYIAKFPSAFYVVQTWIPYREQEDKGAKIYTLTIPTETEETVIAVGFTLTGGVSIMVV
jgi:hypothetical protein